MRRPDRAEDRQNLPVIFLFATVVCCGDSPDRPVLFSFANCCPLSSTVVYFTAKPAKIHCESNRQAGRQSLALFVEFPSQEEKTSSGGQMMQWRRRVFGVVSAGDIC
jgi:hypothetical protein